MSWHSGSRLLEVIPVIWLGTYEAGTWVLHLLPLAKQIVHELHAQAECADLVMALQAISKCATRVRRRELTIIPAIKQKSEHAA